MEAQFRTFEPAAISANEGENINATPQSSFNNSLTDPSGFELVDIFGNPMCCESTPFNFTLTFNSFFVLTQLQNQIASSIRRQREINEWLDAREGDFLKEINR